MAAEQSSIGPADATVLETDFERTGVAADETAFAAAVLPPSPTEVSRIGEYEIVGKLGQGGMGAVYRARHLTLEREVALKVVSSHLAADHESIIRFQREARVAASVEHANLVRIYSAGEIDGTHFIAMELIEGENLHQRLKREPMELIESLRIIADAARGLQCGWDRAKLVHRDIKPANIYLSNKGEVKVGDLGLAKSLDSQSMASLTQTGMMMGTPYYMSPEQVQGDKELDFRADIYSLGCTFYEMLTGKPPYTGRDAISIVRQHLDAPLPAILKVMPSCPIAVARLLGKMLKKQPRDRHASYADLIAEVESAREQVAGGATFGGTRAVAAAMGGGGQTPPRATPAAATPAKATSAPHTTPGQKRSAAPLWIGTVVVIAIVAAGVFFLGQRAKPKPSAAPAVLAGATPGTVAPSAPVSSAAGPATATKDAPFVNSLGMKFVPVPITGGPTGGQRVLFSIWETRMQDYEVFVKETRRGWQRSGLTPEPTSAVGNLTWELTQAFCQWLTDRERNAGRISSGERYRLPTSHEWSCAVGIGDREDPAKPPAEKTKKIADVFPWGTQWPPPPGAGNYCGEEAGSGYTAGPPLQGFNDGFPAMSPVGSFAPNPNGIYDLGGNVWEICQDFDEKQVRPTVLRGGSYMDRDREAMFSSNVSTTKREFYAPTHGFRCVLAPAK